TPVIGIRSGSYTILMDATAAGFPVLELSVERDTAPHARYVAALREWDQHRSLALRCEFWRDVRFASLDDQN
ncbi:hypothetical protein ACFFRM_27110, partial [Rhodococcus aetherivorans]